MKLIFENKKYSVGGHKKLIDIVKHLIAVVNFNPSKQEALQNLIPVSTVITSLFRYNSYTLID